MNFRDDHRPPLSTERSDLYWGTNLSDHDLYLEDLDERPSLWLSLLPGVATARRASGDVEAPGADRPVAPTPMAPGGVSCPPPGPNLEEDQ